MFFLQMSPFLQLQSQLPACLPPLGPQLSTCHVTFLFARHSSITYWPCMLHVCCSATNSECSVNPSQINKDGPQTGPSALQSCAKAALDMELGTCPPAPLYTGPQTSVRVRAEDPRLRAATGNCFHFCPLRRVWCEHGCRLLEPLLLHH